MREDIHNNPRDLIDDHNSHWRAKQSNQRYSCTGYKKHFDWMTTVSGGEINFCISVMYPVYSPQ